MKIVLSGEPLSTSHIYRYHCKIGSARGYMSAEGKARKEQYQWEAKAQSGFRMPLKRAKLTATLFFGRRGRRDWDNYNKLWGDALEGIVYDDDSAVEQATVIKAYDKENPRIELEIEEVSEI